MAKNKRRDKMWADECDRVVEKATALHREITSISSGLTYGGSDHAALQTLHKAIITAIREVTGDDPVWMRVPPALNVGIPGSSNEPV